MKTKQFLTSIFLLVFSIGLYSQEVLPKPRDIDKDYRKEYREDLRDTRQQIKDSESEIQLPEEEMVPIERLTPTEFSTSDFTNWGKAALAPDAVLDRVIEAATYRVFYDVYDTGIDEDHPDMQVGKRPSRDGINEPGGDRNGHGSHVWSTTMGQRGGLVYGLAEKGLLAGRATKVLSGSGSGTFGTYANMQQTGFEEYKAIVDNGGFVVTNSSLGYNGPPINYVENALKEGYEYGGITHVAAAGNSRSDVDYPGSSPYTLAVGAVDRNLNRASFSCYGPNLTCAAPGVSITACWKDGNYATISGTSMASPFVSGWVIAAYSIWGPKLKAPGAVEGYLKGILRDLGEPGRDDYYGYGLAVLNEIVDTDPSSGTPDDPDDPEDPDTPDDPSDPTPPAPGTEEVHYIADDGFIMRWKRESDNDFSILRVDKIELKIKNVANAQEAYDKVHLFVRKYFNNRAVVLLDEMNYTDANRWTGRFLKLVAGHDGIDIEMVAIHGQDEFQRRTVETNFEFAEGEVTGIELIPFLNPLLTADDPDDPDDGLPKPKVWLVRAMWGAPTVIEGKGRPSYEYTDVVGTYYTFVRSVFKPTVSQIQEVKPFPDAVVVEIYNIRER